MATRTETHYRRGDSVNLVTGQIEKNQLIPENETIEIPENKKPPALEDPKCDGNKL